MIQNTNMYRTTANRSPRLTGRPIHLFGSQSHGFGRIGVRRHFPARIPSESNSDGDIEMVEDSDDDGIEITGSRQVPQQIDAKTCQVTEQLVLEPGKDVQLRDESFVRIVEYLPSLQCIRGYRCMSQNHPWLLMKGLKIERPNEIVQLVTLDESLKVQYPTSTFPVTDIKRMVKIFFTNQPFPNLYYGKDIQGSGKDDPGKPVFFCRWSSTDTNIGTDHWDPRGPPLSGRIDGFRMHQADNGTLISITGERLDLKIPDSEVRDLWRGEAKCVLGGSHSQNGTQSYTFGDCFCGAGGTSQGAKDARLKLMFALDKDPLATRTYFANFHLDGPRILTKDVADFCRQATRDPDRYSGIIDILHMSPPCQPFCGANRRPNEEANEKNLSAFARVADLLQIFKPRIATLEEAKSLTDSDKREYFQKLIFTFVKKGYSIQWKTVDFSRFGVPQTRHRTIIIASASVITPCLFLDHW
jgi:hypothetical protein